MGEIQLHKKTQEVTQLLSKEFLKKNINSTKTRLNQLENM
jgi:hypothetical protein